MTEKDKYSTLIERREEYRRIYFIRNDQTDEIKYILNDKELSFTPENLSEEFVNIITSTIATYLTIRKLTLLKPSTGGKYKYLEKYYDCEVPKEKENSKNFGLIHRDGRKFVVRKSGDNQKFNDVYGKDHKIYINMDYFGRINEFLINHGEVPFTLLYDASDEYLFKLIGNGKGWGLMEWVPIV